MKRLSRFASLAAVLLILLLLWETSAFPQGSGSSRTTAPAKPRPKTPADFHREFWQFLTRGKTPYKKWTAWPDSAEPRAGEAPHGAFVKTYANAIAIKDTAALAHGSILVQEELDEELDGTTIQSSHHFASEIKLPVEQSDNAVWVRGRAQQLFLIPNTSEEELPEKSFFWAGFIAVLPGLYGVPFECSDYYGRSGLTFSSVNAPPGTVKDQIAEAFWGLLLSDPHDVADYRATMYHPGISMMIEFGIENGEPFILEREE